ncbi:serine/threonine protein kinase [Streptomyces sp. NPDC059740]|uniref:serine/threonine protein kinase n=1 Tax=Streptomyces sp. NPDC059740 TaxID=3346926 RepID=UPI0036480DE1
MTGVRMEGLRSDDPPRIGGYVTLGRLGPPEDARCDRRYLARGADGRHTAVVSLPPPGADPARWAAEAQWAQRLAQPGFWQVAEIGGTPAFPWHASPYRPVLPLPAALAAYGGPLPEPVVRTLGATLAEALASAHVLGLAHGGLSPAAVLLTAYGPLLGCFGAARAAAPEGVARSGLPGLDPGCLAPEQAVGGPVAPAGDVYALGAVLAYAATGHTVPEREEIPGGLRDLVSACLSRDPGNRPDPARVPGALAPQAAYGALTAATEPVSWPGPVVAALAAQSAGLLAADLSTGER